MNSALKFGLIALAAYWLLRDQLTSPETPAQMPATTPIDPIPASTGTTTPVAAPAPAPIAAPAPSRPLADPLLLAATVPSMANLAGDIRLTADQWNYYNALGRGTVTTADLFTPGNRDELITANEYWARRTAAGLSGIWRQPWAN